MTSKQKMERQTQLSMAHKDYSCGLTSHAYRKVHDKALGQDLVQDTFMKTWCYMVRGRKIDVMKSFLYHVLNNLIVDEYRRKKTASLEVFYEKGFELQSKESPDQLIDTLDAKTAVGLIKKLPKKYQSVLQMYYVQDLSIKEISEETEQSKNAVAVQVHRGLKKLRAMYGKGR